MGDLFKDCIIHIMPLGLGEKRLSLFETQIKKHGGTFLPNLNAETLTSVTHIGIEGEFADVSLQNLVKEFKDLNRDVIVIKLEWISECLKTKTLVAETSYQLQLPPALPEPCKRKVEEASTSASSQPRTKKPLNVNAFVCAHASSSNDAVNTSTKPNQAILAELQKLADAFKAQNDTWRNFGYTKAITAIKKYNKEITSYEEAVAIPGVGDKMASKVWEMLETGKLRRTEEVCEGERAETLKLFIEVWGAGSVTADQWYSLGYRTLEDLRTKATLTNQQKIGLKHYDDIKDRMPREEVTEIVKIVEREAKSMYPKLEVQACGSYRRGKPTCGDIDIVMSHPEKDLRTSLLAPLVKKLTEIGFITDNLVNITDDGHHKKFFGLCRLPGEGHRHRRLDLFVVPWSERGPALLHYTGSAHFNRSMRLLAQKKGMSLSEHALHGVVIRQGREKIASGQALPTPSEESVFEHLGLEYRPPQERDH